MPLITENKHSLRDPEQSSVTRNCQIYIMPLDTLKIGIYKLKYFINCIKVKRNNLFNSIYSSVSQDFSFKKTPYVNFFTDPELSSSLYRPMAGTVQYKDVWIHKLLQLTCILSIAWANQYKDVWINILLKWTTI